MSQISISGKIVDVEDQPLQYANVYFEDKSTGTITNEDGQFSLLVEESEIKSVRICISYIGYEQYCENASFFKDNPIISLTPSATLLDEITVLPQEYLSNPKKIVAKAFSAITETRNTNEFSYDGFYRHINRKDTSYVRLLEAAVKIYDNGYNSSKIHFDVYKTRKSLDLRRPKNKDTRNLVESIFNTKKPSIKEIKKITPLSSESNISTPKDLFDWESNSKHLSFAQFYKTNCVRFYKEQNTPEFGIFNKDFLKEHKFKLDTISELDNDIVYIIKILPNSKSKKYIYESVSLILPVGKLYIRASDFAVLKVEYNYILNPKKKNTFDYRIYLQTHGTPIIFRTISIYKEYNNKMYLSYMYKYELDPMALGSKERSESNYKSGYYYLERELLINSINTENGKKIEFNEKDLNPQLFRQNYDYDEEFWKEFITLEETEKERKLRSDLEKKISLSEQFEMQED